MSLNLRLVNPKLEMDFLSGLRSGVNAHLIYICLVYIYILGEELRFGEVVVA